MDLNLDYLGANFREAPLDHLRPQAAYQKGALLGVGRCRAGTAAQPPAAGTLRNRPEIRIRPGPGDSLPH